MCHCILKVHERTPSWLSATVENADGDGGSQML